MEIEESKLLEQKMKRCEQLGAREFQKFVLWLEQKRYRFLKRHFPNLHPLARGRAEIGPGKGLPCPDRLPRASLGIHQAGTHKHRGQHTSAGKLPARTASLFQKGFARIFDTSPPPRQPVPGKGLEHPALDSLRGNMDLQTSGHPSRMSLRCPGRGTGQPLQPYSNPNPLPPGRPERRQTWRVRRRFGCQDIPLGIGILPPPRKSGPLLTGTNSMQAHVLQQTQMMRIPA